MSDRHDVKLAADTPQTSFAAEFAAAAVASGTVRARLGAAAASRAQRQHRAHSGSIVEYESAQRLPGVEVVEQYEDCFGLARGTLAAQRARARAAELESPHDGSVDEHFDVVCPYKEVRSFEYADAALFFGRKRQAEEVLKRLAEVRFAAVVGESRSSKSSFARAGLLAQVRSGAADGSTSAPVALLTRASIPSTSSLALPPPRSGRTQAFRATIYALIPMRWRTRPVRPAPVLS
jgi:hypothetical protein